MFIFINEICFPVTSAWQTTANFSEEEQKMQRQSTHKHQNYHHMYQYKHIK